LVWETSGELPGDKRLWYQRGKQEPGPGSRPPGSLDVPSTEPREPIRRAVSAPRRYLSSRLRGGPVPSDSGRLYRCAGCGRQVIICRRCDRGNRYCGVTCRQQARRQRQKEARQRYQQSWKGRRKAAQRQQRYRDRGKQKVTHQSPQPGAPGAQRGVSQQRSAEQQTAKEQSHDATGSPHPPVEPAPPGAGAKEEEPPVVRCALCGRRCSEYIRLRSLVECPVVHRKRPALGP
jgi:hypothetical protein